MSNLLNSYKGDKVATEVIHKLAIDSIAQLGYSLKNGSLFHKYLLFVGSKGPLRDQLLALYHNIYLGGHLGVYAFYIRLKKHFFWPGMLNDVMESVKGCETCARCKTEHC